MTHTQKHSLRGRIAVGASAVAVAATIWGVTTLVATGDGRTPRHENPSGPTGTDDRAGGSKPSTGPSTGTGTGPGAQPAGVPDSIAHASEAGGNAVNITIDDGPDPRWTPQVLATLAKYEVKATFCMIGPQAKAHPDLVKKVVAAGHRLCDHSMDHDTSMDKKPVAYQEAQILDAKKLIEEAAGAGVKVEYYRAPGGAFTPDSRRIAAAHGMRPLGWNVDTKDFGKPGVAAIVDAVKREIGNGPTVLFHDGGGNRQQTVEALDQVLAWLREQGRPTGFPVRTAS
ncbi:polysaccharide deacetylase family protein [Streptomyces sp. NBC_00091]|uniref:polysaccharide deacetylase family protein n=1 Tax=Streptomyces sp. NBC_00091 TaxID=2975648 RepID=UPI0022526FF4|nr:polysaccharide deacetylase family protein [Streptomyces sp. NBC_00091]MCX5376195.1 polysaccharide deacetylase family protein [Streptomyces sp. NBC_00091]